MLISLGEARESIRTVGEVVWAHKARDRLDLSVEMIQRKC